MTKRSKTKGYVKMKFQTDVFTLYDGFNKVLKVLPRGISLPVLEKLYIETTKQICL